MCNDCTKTPHGQGTRKLPKETLSNNTNIRKSINIRQGKEFEHVWGFLEEHVYFHGYMFAIQFATQPNDMKIPVKIKENQRQILNDINF